MEDDIVEDAITIEDCKNMSWKDFEIHVGKLYEKMGYEVEKTSGGGDHGCDLVMSKNGRKTVVDAKHWESDVHSKVVGQVLRAISYYDANNGIIIGISHFTKGVIEEAEKLPIELIDVDRLEKLLEDYPTSLQKSQSISDIRAEDIYSKYPDFGGIIKKMVLKVLKYRDGDYRVSASFLIQEIKSKLVLELIPPDAERMCLAKTLELLKDRYSIDLYKEEREDEKKLAQELEIQENHRLEKLRLEAESEKRHQAALAVLAKQREMKRIRDGMVAHDGAEERSIPKAKPIVMSPEKAKKVLEVMTRIKHFETENGYGGFKGPVPMDLLVENQMGEKISVADLAGILKTLIRNGAICESKRGYYNTI